MAIKNNKANWQHPFLWLNLVKNRIMSLEEIKRDVRLRGYFFDLISRNLVLGLTNTFDVKPKDYAKLNKEYYACYQVLSTQLEGLVNEPEIFNVIQEVSMYYLEQVGSLHFVHREFRSSNN